MRRLNPYTELIPPEVHFGFRNKHSTIEQVQRTVSYMEELLEKKNILFYSVIEYNSSFQQNIP